MGTREQTLSVLVVDDDDITMKRLERLLAKEGFSVTSTPSGMEARTLVNEKTFDLILTDLMMSLR